MLIVSFGSSSLWESKHLFCLRKTVWIKTLRITHNSLLIIIIIAQLHQFRYKVLFSNRKSTLLFGCDLTSDLNPQSKLGQKRFIAYDMIQSNMQDQHNELVSKLASQNQTEKHAESRLNKRTCLVSLKNILDRTVPTEKASLTDGQKRVEVYNMIADHELPMGNIILTIHIKITFQLIQSYIILDNDALNRAKSSAKTIIVNRMPMTFDEQECLVVNFTDISAYVNLQEQQESYNLLKTLNAQVHHEMIVPLKVNVEMAQILLDDKTVTDSQKKLVANILVSSNLVMLHAHDFLDQSLIEKGVFMPQYSVVSPIKVIKNTIKIVELTLKQRQLKIEYNDEDLRHMRLKLDQRRLQQVLLNLLNNAVKFQRNGKILVEAAVIIPPDDRGKRLLRVKVRDFGVGISNAQLKDIFTPFNISARRSEFGGNGVGLSICKAICTSLNGGIEAESTVGVGTIITFSHQCFFVDDVKKKKTKSKKKALDVIIEKTLEDDEESKSQLGPKKPSVQEETEFENQVVPKPHDKNSQCLDNQVDQVQIQSVAVKSVKVDSSEILGSSKQSSILSQELTVSFQGHEILIDHSKPLTFQLQAGREDNGTNQIERLLQFLNTSASTYLSPNEGTIVIVDDQFVSQQSIQLKISDLLIKNEVRYFSNGQEAVEFLDEILDKVWTSEPQTYNPITLILMDINMPIMTGIEAVKLIKQSYDNLNQFLVQQQRRQLIRPAILYYSQYNKQTMEQFIANDELADFYLEKPVPTREIEALFTLLSITGQEAQSQP